MTNNRNVTSGKALLRHPNIFLCMTLLLMLCIPGTVLSQEPTVQEPPPQPPVAETPAEPTGEAPVEQTAPVQEPAAEAPTTQVPAAETPALQTPAVQTPSVQPPTAQEPAEEENWLDLPFQVTGSYKANYYGRWNTDDKNDHQLFQYLTLHIPDLVPDKISVHFLGRLSAELNGREEDDEFFFDILDTWNDDVDGRVYYLYADIIDPVFEKSNLRLGRQYSYESESVYFTGAKYDQTLRKLRYYLLGGVWTSNYQDTDLDDETIGGGGLDYQLSPNTILGYDFLRVVEDYLDDTYHDVNITQRFGSLRGYGQLSLLNNKVDELNLYGNYYYSPMDINLTGRYFALLSPRERLTNQFSALIGLDSFDTEDDDTAGTLFPFHLVNLSLYKGWWEKYGTTAGFETRWMDENDERNYFNREYDRYFLILQAWDFYMKRLTTTLTFEYWDANAGEDSMAVGIDLEREIREDLELGGGFYFSRYRMHYTFSGENFTDETNTPELYVRVKYLWKENVELLARYEVETEEELGTTHRIRLGVEIDF